MLLNSMGITPFVACPITKCYSVQDIFVLPFRAAHLEKDLQNLSLQ